MKSEQDFNLSIFVLAGDDTDGISRFWENTVGIFTLNSKINYNSVFPRTNRSIL